MTNREKFLNLVSQEETQSIERNRARIKDRIWLRESQEIAMKILDKLDVLNWTQKDLAEKMGVSPQYINKVVKGKENLSLETIAKFQQILEIPILASYYEANTEKMEAYIMEVASSSFSNDYTETTEIYQLSFEVNTDSYTYSKVG